MLINISISNGAVGVFYWIQSFTSYVDCVIAGSFFLPVPDIATFALIICRLDAVCPWLFVLRFCYVRESHSSRFRQAEVSFKQTKKSFYFISFMPKGAGCQYFPLLYSVACFKGAT